VVDHSIGLVVARIGLVVARSIDRLVGRLRNSLARRREQDQRRSVLGAVGLGRRVVGLGVGCIC